jgi:tetratricopeptide (TPR) repeat protein
MIDEQLKIKFVLSQAKSLADEGKYLHALQLYNKILSEAAQTPEPYIQCSLLYLNNGQVDSAIRTLEDGFKLFPKDEDIIFRLGILCHQSEQYHKSIGFLKRLRKRHSITIHYALGVAYLKIDNYERAKEYLRIVQKSDSKYPHVNFHLGEALFKLNLYAESLKYLKNEISLNPADWEAHYYQGIVYLRLMEYKKALAAFEAVNKIDPNNLTGITKSGECLLELKKYDEARSYLDLALSSNPNFIDALVVLGRLHDAVGDNENANEVLSKASKIDPHNVMIRKLYQKVKSKQI